MFSIVDLLLLPIAVLPGAVMAGYRTGAQQRGTPGWGYGLAMGLASVLAFGPAVFALAVLLPRMDRSGVPVWASLTYPLLCLVAGTLLAFVLLLWQGYYLDRDRRSVPGTVGQYLSLNLKFLLFILVPAMLVGAGVGVAVGMPWVPGTRLWDPEVVPVLLGLTLAAGAALRTTIAPLRSKKLIRSRPLTDPLLRSALESLGDRLRVPLSDVRVSASTNGRVPHAPALEYWPRERAVVLTRVILERLSRDELLALFAHECGHVRRGHLWRRAALQTALLLAMAGAIRLLTGAMGPLPLSLPLGMSLLPFGVGAMVARRQDFAADRFAAAHTSAVALVAALTKLDSLDFGPRPSRLPRWLRLQPALAARMAGLRRMV